MHQCHKFLSFVEVSQPVLYAIIIFPIRGTGIGHFILIDLITLIICNKEYKL
jgi:hypothetical protein